MFLRDPWDALEFIYLMFFPSPLIYLFLSSSVSGHLRKTTTTTLFSITHLRTMSGQKSSDQEKQQPGSQFQIQCLNIYVQSDFLLLVKDTCLLQE